MKLKVLFFSVLITTLTICGCNTSRKTLTNTLNITSDDEKIILEYLDKKTNDIAFSREGKMYSAFILLGTSNDEIYIWVTKTEYFNFENKITNENGDSVSLPMVLKIKKMNNSIKIISHKYPQDGIYYGKSKSKLFPSNIRFPDNDEILKLDEIIKKRAEEDFKKNQ